LWYIDSRRFGTVSHSGFGHDFEWLALAKAFITMNSFIIAAFVFFGYLLAYHTYGKFLARKIFRLIPETVCPSAALQDNHDFAPTGKHILFGHHLLRLQD